MSRDDDLTKVLKVADVVAARYCARYRVRPWMRDDVRQTAAMVAIEKLESIPAPIDERLNWIARAVHCRLIDCYRSEKRKNRIERLECNFKAEPGAAPFAEWFGVVADPETLLARDLAKTQFWEAFDSTLDTFDDFEREIVRRRILMNERFREITEATGVRKKKILAVVQEFGERLKERL